MSAGDALVVRVGVGAEPRGAAGAELHDSVLPWLRQRDISVLAFASSVSQAHFTGVVLGTANLHTLELEALSEALASRKRWEFMLTVVPMPILGGTASNVNLIATF